MVWDLEGDEQRPQLRRLRKLGGRERLKTGRKGREVKRYANGNKGVGALVPRGVLQDRGHGRIGR